MSVTFEEFSRIRDELLTPERVRNAYVRSVGEMCHTLKMKVVWLNPKFNESVTKVKRPFGWRREILQLHRKSILKNLVLDNLYNPNPLRRLGRMIGVFENSIQGLDNEHFYPQEEKFWEAVFAPFLDLDEGTKRKICEHMEYVTASYDKILAYVTSLPLSEQKEFSLGRAEKMDAIFGMDSSLTYSLTTTQIYNFLLMTGDTLCRLDSVEDIYEFAKLWLGQDVPHDLESFRKICYRIGLRGANYSSSVRRKKSMDRAKL